MKLKDKLKYYRKKAHMTQSELANKSGISLRAISNYENGLRTPPLEILIKIAKALNIQATDLDSNTHSYMEHTDNVQNYVLDSKSTIGENIRKIRESKGLLMKDLADKLDITEQAIYQYEKDIRTPNTKQIFKIADLLGVEPDTIDIDLKNYLKYPIKDKVSKEPDRIVEATIKIYENSDIYKLRIDISNIIESDMKSEDLLAKIVAEKSVIINDVVYIKLYDIFTSRSYLININRINKFELSNISNVD